jgi:hypothetical protein
MAARGMTELLVAATKRQAQIRPQSRSQFLGRLGFEQLLRANPLSRAAAPSTSRRAP